MAEERPSGDDDPVTSLGDLTSTQQSTQPATVPPAASRATTPGWRDPRLWIGVVIVAVSVVAGSRLLAAADDSVPVWAASGDLATGDELTGADLVARRVRFVDAADLDRYFPADQALPAELRLRQDVGSGELLPRSAIGSAEEAGVLQLPVAVEPAALPPGVGGRVGRRRLPAAPTAGARSAPRPPSPRSPSSRSRRRTSSPATQQVVLAVDQQGVDRWFDLLSGVQQPRSRSWPGADVVVVLVLAAGAGWESAALAALAGRSDVVVLKRCVDVADLLATAAAGQADVAVVGLDAPGLDAAAVDHLRGDGVRPVAVLPRGADLDAAQLRATRIGVGASVADDDLDRLAEAVTADDRTPRPLPRRPAAAPGRVDPGRVVAVWGPAGAPGRTTLAVGLAAELAAASRTMLVDADPYGGAVAQQLGVVDEVSGVLAAARLVATGQLAERFGGVQRSLDHRLSVVTGLPRADRWVEIRAGVVEQLLEVAAAARPRRRRHRLQPRARPGRPTAAARPGRNTMTLEALEAADEVVVVGSADPVGLCPAGPRAGRARGRSPRAAPVRVRGQPDAADARLVRAATSPGCSVACPRSPGCTSCPRTGAAVDRALVGRPVACRPVDSAWARGAAGSQRVDRRRSPPLAQALAGARRRSARRVAGSGGEEQVEPAHGEGDHRHQHRQLAGDLVPRRQHRERPVVRGDRRHDVPDHDRAHLDRGQQASAATRAR